MAERRLIDPPQEKFVWSNEILAIKKGEEVVIKKKYSKTVTPIISKDVRLKDPDRKFETDSKSDPDHLIIKCIN
ncbi:hypothetical protein SNE25_21260 [Mucilaginibacter sabulilitoris]|uniref:Hypervirulence associated protein TUDOR domain-containing protein n=1 Tax=Mucilaginibacter sabulilitoris TaxID=1173583 RepID=A0ABZ0TJY0_9SPHI|nr:hypothetical protein [Mucilaginibacter sabulilitoris]WPU91850.1 hypothetical protein SNE25_21260 [Mucilaginibacter sabulilitoris]